MSVRPGWMDADRLARSLGCPKRFLGRLTVRGMLPRAVDGRYRVSGVGLALRARPWLARLGVPMCERELSSCLRTADVVMPSDLCVPMAGRDYCVLWRAAEATWDMLPRGEDAPVEDGGQLALF